MNDILKQRLVGALILVALGVVFWPIIFVQPGGESSTELRSIPPPPGVSMAPIAAPDEVGLRGSLELTGEDDNQRVEVSRAVDSDPEEGEEVLVPSPTQTEGTAVPPPSAVSSTRETRTEAPEPLAMDSDGLPVAWTLQVATLSSSDKADALRRQLLDMNHKAYVTQVQRDGKMLYRVCIGPKFERSQLEGLQANIDARFGVNSLVARYMP